MRQPFVYATCVVCVLLAANLPAAPAPATRPSTRPTTSPSDWGTWFAPPTHTPAQPHSGQPVQIVLKTRPEITFVALEYQLVDPGEYVELKDPAYASKWVSVPMKADKGAKDPATFTAVLSGNLQTHRRLVRYRFKATDAGKHPFQAPEAGATTANFAYFVYDGVPGWTAAINPKSKDPNLARPLFFPPRSMRRVQAYQLIGKKTSVENVTWKEQIGGKEYKYTGTLVVNDIVYDHIRYRARGGTWRFALGKNMWKFALPDDHRLHALDDFGQPYPAAWSKVNLRPCIQLGTYGMRGEQGMFEAVGFRLFNLAGVPAPRTNWVQLRIVDEPREAPADQYQGDFWGLYLAIEDEDGRFLKAHDLPDGNLYKMGGGNGSLSHQGKSSVTDQSDLKQFLETYNGGEPAEKWWRDNLNLPAYYSYRSIVECIHHYDIGDGKNYDYYHNPITKQWQVVPWDIDLTWADPMYGNGEEPFNSKVLGRPVFRIEYQNRLREIRDLLYNPDQAGRIIDECTSIIWDTTGAPPIAEADRRKWDFHPVLAMGGQAGQGLFYQAVPSKDFPGMVQRMRDYVKTRGEWIDVNLLNDPQVPATPTATYTGPARYPVNGLRFRAAPYKGANPLAAIQWRLAEVAPAAKPLFPIPKPRGPYEIAAAWQSEELKDAAVEVQIPPGTAKAAHLYRVRVRMKDSTGRWSHWSPAVEFLAGSI